MMTAIRVVLLLVLKSVVRGELHYVSPGLSVQDTVNAAIAGDTVILEDGTHYATVVLYGKDLAIGSRYLLDDDTAHISATIVQPDWIRPDTNSCFVYAFGETPSGRLAGLTLREGRGTAHAGHAYAPCGGGVYVWGAGATIEHCRIDSCRATIGGGLFALGYGDSARVNFSYCNVASCTATDGGGGFFLSLATMHATSCIFQGDSALGWQQQGLGSAILANGHSLISLDSCHFTVCAGTDAAVEITNYSSGTLSNCIFDHNLILYDLVALAADLRIHASYMTVTRCHFDENYSGSEAVYLGGTVPYHFVGNVVENGFTSVGTGAIAIDGHRGDVGYNVIRNYVNSHGGTIYSHLNGEFNPMVRVHHNVITNNVSLDSQEPSVFSIGDLRPTLDSNWISGNGGFTMDFNASFPPGGTLDARNNWWGDPTGPYHPTLNPNGQGDSLLTDSVLFIPWLTEPPDTMMPPDYLPVDEPPEVPRTWQVLECYPNPFNSSIRIVLAGFTGRDFEITLHNLLGQVVDVIHRGPMTGGEIAYQAPAYLASGVYFIRATDRIAVQSRKVILLK